MIAQGSNLRDAFRYALEHGYLVEHRRRTGEKVIRHPDQPKPVVVNSPRKSAPRVLISFLNRYSMKA